MKSFANDSCLLNHSLFIDNSIIYSNIHEQFQDVQQMLQVLKMLKNGGENRKR